MKVSRYNFPVLPVARTVAMSVKGATGVRDSMRASSGLERCNGGRAHKLLIAPQSLFRTRAFARFGIPVALAATYLLSLCAKTYGLQSTNFF